ncbi:MAG: hypothetical protein NWF11_07435 [Candidatus Bathyarchaeota archaeon]|nr:hypothetical protein [Candidatus Bathyarchaeota archaeon]
MRINIKNRPQLTGIIVLFIGVALLAFTFINSFLFLQEPVGIIASADLAEVFGEALAPLIQACIRLMYLGIMGWIGSLLTVRGIPLVTQKTAPITPATRTTQPKPQPKTQPKPEKLTPTPSPETAYSQQTNPKPQTETPQQKSQLIPEPRQEEPKAILITPENQREE